MTGVKANGQNILLLSAGRRVELLNGIQAAASRLIPSAVVICADYDPAMSSACQECGNFVSLPRATDPHYADALLALCLDRGIGLVIPTIDTELLVLAQLRDQFAISGVALMVSDKSLIAACRDKRQTSKLFHALGMPTPEIFLPNAIQFPCFSKPAGGSSSIGAFRIEDESQLTPLLLSESDRMFMELVPDGLREITIDIYYDRHERMQAAVPRERLAVRAGEIAKGVTRRDWVYSLLTARMSTLAGARGCLTLQLFADDTAQAIFAIEINARFGGGYPLALAAGADYPAWLIREYLLGEEISYFDDWETDLLMLRYDAKVLVHGHR